ncbi:zinc dependent phospholipase C family protein (plasmid) [Haloimpatiens sp. FM7330]|uniref:zinc dependent phospholipase C family protein n=1 Tax=Haloimpatiens sp. FM7330 TaxID=3298610 RepID=UPI00363E5BF5
MATWITHLRIAENILNLGFKFDEKAFVVGNIGPDSGVPNEDWSNFDPPKKVTHWQGEDHKIKAVEFWDKYLNNADIKNDIETYSFYMGYYVHLLTDIEWSKLFNKKKQTLLYKNGLDKDKNFIWTIKKDWYGLDYIYLSKNPNCIFHTCFKNINEVPDYLDYFPHKAFERQVKYITDFYLGENEETKENFIYLTEKEMDNFVEQSTDTIREAIMG